MKFKSRLIQSACQENVAIHIHPYPGFSLAFREKPGKSALGTRLRRETLELIHIIKFYPVCHFGKYINFGLGTVWSEKVKATRISLVDKFYS